MKKSTLGKIAIGLMIGGGFTATGILGYKFGIKRAGQATIWVLDRMCAKDPTFKDHFEKTFNDHILPEFNKK